MTWKTQLVHYSPDSTEGGGSIDTAMSTPATTIEPEAANANIESFLSSLDTGAIADGVQPDTTPKEVLVDESGKPAVEPVPKPAALPSVHNQKVREEKAGAPKTAPIQSTQRDLSGFAEADAALLRQMSNPAFEWTKGKLDELRQLNEAKANYEKELATLKESGNRWLYDHEEAYTLSPEYRQQAGTVQLYNNEFNHWSRQLANAQAGRPVYDISLDKDGKLVVGTEAIEATPEVIAQIHANMIAANGARQEAFGKLQTWQAGHKQKFQAFRQKVTGLEQQLFPKGITPEIQPQIEKAMQMFPAELRGDPLVRALGIASVIFTGYQARLQELEAQLNGKQALKGAEARQGSADPKPSSRNASSTQGRTVEEELARLTAGI